MSTDVSPACVSVHTICVPEAHSTGFPGTGVTASCDLQSGCWEFNLGTSGRGTGAPFHCWDLSPAPARHFQTPILSFFNSTADPLVSIWVFPCPAAWDYFCMVKWQDGGARSGIRPLSTRWPMSERSHSRYLIRRGIFTVASCLWVKAQVSISFIFQ